MLYSKYSQNSKRILENLTSSGMDFSFLTKVCVDNQNFRKRILYADQLSIKEVPCIILFRDNVAEKYEGGKAFEWVREIIDRQLDVIREEKARLWQVEQEELRREEENLKKTETEPENIELREHQEQLRRNQQMAQEKADYDHGKMDGSKISGKTSLDDLGEDEPEETDRLTNISERTQPVPRRKQILKDKGNYEEDEDLYSGEETDQRRATGNVIRTEPRDGTKQAHRTYSQAEQMQKERESLEAELASPMKRPMEARRP